MKKQCIPCHNIFREIKFKVFVVFVHEKYHFAHSHILRERGKIISPFL